MPTSPFSLHGQRALITGSSQGIGLAIAKALSHSGAQVVINGRNQAKLDAILSQESGEHPTMTAHAFDVTNPEAVQAAATAIGPVDILVNNAGIQRRTPLIEATKADWDLVLSTNLTSAFLVGQAFAKSMIERRSGKIINICSLMSDLARPTTGPYTAAKGGLRMLTRAMCAEWAEHNIQINGIAPGYISTELTAPLANDPKFDAWIKARTPSRRWGTVEDLTGAAIFFASPASNYLNGQILAVDGGLSAVI